MKTEFACMTVLLLPFVSPAAERHVDSVVKEILTTVEAVKSVVPDAVPMAFWDFDGTIVKGDVTEGLEENGEQRFKGLVEETAYAGLCSVYKGWDGWRQYSERDYPRMNEIGRWLAWPYNAQLFEGRTVVSLDAFCKSKFESVFRKWYFVSSLAMLNALEKAGVENYIVSASPEMFVRNAAETLGLPRSRFNGIRVAEHGGRFTTQLEYPVPYAEGKVEIVRRVVLSRPRGVAVAGFGNSYSTDGAFLRYIVSQPLPGGVRGTALMINGGKPKPGFEGLFRCVEQSATAGHPSPSVQ